MNSESAKKRTGIAPRKKRNLRRVRRIESFFRMEQVYRRRFLVPNAVTLANLFCGFLAIVYSTSSRPSQAALAIILAIVLDGLDGRVARRLNASSEFGVEFDSFSDLVSFGLAPAILIYNWAFLPIADEFGVFVCFVYALAAAARLARFNVQSSDLKKFSGLPTPGAAGLVASIVYLSPGSDFGEIGVGVFSFVMLSLALLMVSEIEFLSVKSFHLGKPNKFVTAALGAGIAFAWYNSKVALFSIGAIYVLSGPYLFLRSEWIKRRSKEGSKDEQSPPEILEAPPATDDDTVGGDA